MTEEVRPLETGWLGDTPVDDNLFRRFLHNQGELNEMLAACVDGGRSSRTDDVVMNDHRQPVAFLNQALLLRPLTGLDDPVLEEVEAFVDEPGASPASLLSAWPTPDLSSRGWMLYGHPAFVARGGWSQPRAAATDGVEVRDIDESTIAEFDRVMVEGYPMPEATGLPPGSMYPAAALGLGLRLRVGYVDGTPVAAGAGYVAHGVVNMCGAATLPAARRRGVWGALVRARMADAPDLPAVAFTSDYSRPGFDHLGFLVVTRFTLWGRVPT
jgi:hypothetical protein